MSNHNEDSHAKIPTSRLEAFSDGVMAIIITITVLELKVPQGRELLNLWPLLPLFFTYGVSFQIVGTYWNNHHHLLQVTDHVSPGIMWANLNLLFWLSFIPFTTSWLGQNHGGSYPTALYSGLLLVCAFSYSLLQFQVIKHAEKREELVAELKRSKKGFISLLSYSLALALAFLSPIVSDVLILFVAALWFVPDRRIEKVL